MTFKQKNKKELLINTYISLQEKSKHHIIKEKTDEITKKEFCLKVIAHMVKK